MANASAKKLATNNAKTLKDLHRFSFVVNVAVLALYYGIHRPRSIKPFLIFSIPSWLIEFTLDKTGRPTFDSAGRLLKSGTDLDQKGLTEYMWDIVYLTWIADILYVLFASAKAYFLLFAIPLFAAVKVYSLFQGFKAHQQQQQQQQQQDLPPSKRQVKLENRNNNLRQRA